MRETYVQIRKFLYETWFELFRWMLLFLIPTVSLTTAILWWRFSTYPFIVYFIEFFACFAAAWIFMFMRQPDNKEFIGDK